MPRFWVWIALSGAIALPARGQTPRIQTLTFLSSADGSEQPYALYLPKSLEPGKKYPLVISLHAEDSNHRFNVQQVLGVSARSADGSRYSLLPARAALEIDFLVASPFARGAMGYTGIAEVDVYDVLADVERRFPVDVDRIYLTGVSMGGRGALRLALTRPDVWAAVAAVCPAPSPEMSNFGLNALHLPVRLFHGEQDPVVPVASSRRWQRLLLDAGVAADYLEYPALRHNAWDVAYRDGAVFRWFGQYRREGNPQRVHLIADSYRYAAAYWVRVDAFTPGTEAVIDARRVGADQILVETHSVDGFTLSPDRPATTISIDGTALRAKTGNLSFHRQAGRWVSGRAAPSRKRLGSEGPIPAAVSGRHLYVFGTGGDPSAAELEFRRRTAEAAAQWGGPSPTERLSFPVKADREVTPQELDSDSLVLFGTRETNALIARFADRLPLALSAGAADYGLLFVVDLGRHYALINSGLPWWTGFDDSGRRLDPFAPPRYAELESFGDYVIFKGSVAHVMAEGRFDRNWKVPAEAVAKIQGIGTVSVK